MNALIKQRVIDQRAFWSGLDAAAAPLASLAIAFGLLRSLGSQDYGILVIALAVSGLSAAINPALAATTTKFVSEADAVADKNRAIARVLSAALAFAVALDLLLLGGAALFEDALSRLIFGGPGAATIDLASVLLLAVLAVCIQQLDGVLAAAIRGLERFRLQALVETAARIIGASVVVLTGWISGDVRWVLIAYCASYVASALARALVLQRLLSGVPLLCAPTRREFQRVLSFGGWMWLTAVANIAYLNVDRIVVGRVWGPAAAGEYNVMLQISQLVHYVPASLFAFSFPMFSRLSATAGGQGEIRSTYWRTALAIAALALVIGAAEAAFGGQLLGLLAAGQFQLNRTAFLLLVGGFLLLTFNIAPYYLLLGTGRSQSVAIVTTLSSAAALALTMLLTPRYGLEGAALARFGYICGTLLLIVLAHAALRTARSAPAE